MLSGRREAAMMEEKLAMIYFEMIHPERMGVSLSKWVTWAEENGSPIVGSSEVVDGFSRIHSIVEMIEERLAEAGYTEIIRTWEIGRKKENEKFD